MRVVVADTSPLNYLVLIDHIGLLPKIFQTLHIPLIVRDELARAAAPAAVRDWISSPPAWLIIEPTPAISGIAPNLDAGERSRSTWPLSSKRTCFSSMSELARRRRARRDSL